MLGSSESHRIQINSPFGMLCCEIEFDLLEPGQIRVVRVRAASCTHLPICGLSEQLWMLQRLLTVP